MGRFSETTGSGSTPDFTVYFDQSQPLSKANAAGIYFASDLSCSCASRVPAILHPRVIQLRSILKL
jgi:hypothetical protein